MCYRFPNPNFESVASFEPVSLHGRGSGRKAVCKLCLTPTVAQVQVSAGDQEAAHDAFAVATFVPAQADICRLLRGKTAFDVRNILIDTWNHPARAICPGG